MKLKFKILSQKIV